LAINPKRLIRPTIGPYATETLNRLALRPFLDEVREERVAEVDRIAAHVDTSLTELLARADQEIGRANEDQEQGIAGAEGRLAQAENRHSELLSHSHGKRALKAVRSIVRL
jgi:hypothetical protein